MKEIPKIIDTVFVPLVSILLALILGGITIFALGESPLKALVLLYQGVFLYPEGVGYMLFYATTFIFAGLSVSIAFQASLFNIGSEGQGLIGGLTLMATALWLQDLLPAPLVIFFAMLAAFVGGALWALIPAYLQAYRGSHIVITTIMFNFIAYALTLWVILNFYMTAGNQVTGTPATNKGISLPFIHEVFNSWFDWELPYSPLNFSFFIAIIAVIAVWILIFKTKWGFELRVLGQSSSVATYAGINPRRTIVKAICLSGALAGLMALNDILGYQHKMIALFTAGAGFVGIAVSLMGRNHPFGIFFAALLFGFLYQGGAELAFEMPSLQKDVIIGIQGLIILFVGMSGGLVRPILNKIYLRLSNILTKGAHDD